MPLEVPILKGLLWTTKAVHLSPTKLYRTRLVGGSRKYYDEGSGTFLRQGVRDGDSNTAARGASQS